MAPPRPAPTTTVVHDDKLDLQEGLLRGFRERLFAFKTLSWPLRLLVIGTILQVAGIVVLIAVQAKLPADTPVGYFGGHQLGIVPLIVYLITLLSIIFGCALALTAALRMDLAIRFPVFLLVLLLLAVEPITQAVFYAQFSLVHFTGSESTWRTVQFIILGIFLVWAFNRPLPSKDKAIVTFMEVLGLLALYYLCEAIIWWNYSDATHAVNTIFAQNLYNQAYYLPVLLSLVIYWSGTDMAEWGEMTGNVLTRWLAKVRFTWLLGGITLLVIAGVGFDLVRDFNFSTALPGLLTATLLAIILVVLAWWAHITPKWATHIPVSALITGAVALFFAYQLTPIIAQKIVFYSGFSQNLLLPIEHLAIVGVVLISLLLGLALLGEARADENGQEGAIGFVLIVVALMALPFHVTTLLHMRYPAIPIINLTITSLIIVTIVSVIIFIVWQGIRGRLDAQLLLETILLLVALEVIHWVLKLPNGLQALGLTTITAVAVLLFAALLWDLLLSGKDITNNDTPGYPRSARIMLYMAYMSLSAVTLLYLSSLRLQGSGAQGITSSLFPSSILTTFDAFSTTGLFYLGVPTLVLGFVQRVARTQTIKATDAGRLRHVTKMPKRRQQVTWSVAVASIALSGVVLAVQTIPAVTYQPYFASIPGADCDVGNDALWTYSLNNPPLVTCLPTGMQLALTPGTFRGGVGFYPPSGHITANYRISVDVNISALTQGCAEIVTRSFSYTHYLCPTGDFGIADFSPVFSEFILQHQTTSLSAFNHLVVTVEHETFTMSVNGAMVAFTSKLQEAPTTAFIGLYLTSTPHDAFSTLPKIPVQGSAIFRNFFYIPLN